MNPRAGGLMVDFLSLADYFIGYGEQWMTPIDTRPPPGISICLPPFSAPTIQQKNPGIEADLAY